jgi:hypothetical protein
VTHRSRRPGSVGPGPRQGGLHSPRGVWCAAAASLCAACAIGEGQGEVLSDRLYVQDCWAGPFDLRPTFFAANPFQDTLTIRIQRGQQTVLESDGFSMLVNGVQDVRENRLGDPLPLALPPGVSPPGYRERDVAEPAVANLTLYLNNSCRGQNASLSAVSGTVSFSKLFSGDLNEEIADDRLTIGEFSAVVVDPRDVVGRGDDGALLYDQERTSEVRGSFNFVFHRGTPAQPFP